MSAKREVPYEVAREGGLPTYEEFEGVWTAFANVPPRCRVVWPVTERLGYRE
jgi:hypothetical protein